MSDIFDRFSAMCLEETVGDNGCRYVYIYFYFFNCIRSFEGKETVLPEVIFYQIASLFFLHTINIKKLLVRYGKESLFGSRYLYNFGLQ